MKKESKTIINSNVARSAALVAALLADPKELGIDIDKEKKRSDRHGSYIELKTEIQPEKPDTTEIQAPQEPLEANPFRKL